MTLKVLRNSYNDITLLEMYKVVLTLTIQAICPLEIKDTFRKNTSQLLQVLVANKIQIIV